MLSKFQQAHDHLTTHREELRLITNSIEDALWAQDAEGKIEWMNPAFKRVFSQGKKEHRHYYWDIIREPALLDFIKGFGDKEKPRMQEISFEGHFYLINGSTNRTANRHIFILQNIDIIRQTEQMKRDFAVNVAHELRTPLTAIKGFAEALKDDAKPENVRYLRIIQNHTERLINLVSDLQTLSKLEQMPSLNLQNINLQTFFEGIRVLFQPIFEQRGLDLLVEIDPAMPRWTVDPIKFEQIFINLVDNALRYTTEGEISIRTKLLEHALQIEVSDTGCGMAAEHLSRIFERFYVADPSRNKDQSGTGLGLAIVKHTVFLHRGTIDVTSTEGKGTCFTLLYPLPTISDSTDK